MGAAELLNCPRVGSNGRKRGLYLLDSVGCADVPRHEKWALTS